MCKQMVEVRKAVRSRCGKAAAEAVMRRIFTGMVVHDAITGPYRNENKQEIVY